MTMCQAAVMDQHCLQCFNSLPSLFRLALTFSAFSVALALPWPQFKNDENLKPSSKTQAFLRTLPSHKLDLLLESFLEQLEDDIFNIYQSELKKQEIALRHMHRSRRDTFSSIDSPPNILPDWWYSYSFDTGVKNREGMKVERLDFVESLANVKISSYFPLHLTNLPALFKDENDVSYRIQSGSLEVVDVRNEWTANTTGCPCGGTGSQDGRSHESCACCVAGNCLCGPLMGYEGDACVPCGAEPFLCASSSHSSIKMDGAVGFQYTILMNELQRIIVTLSGHTLSFYKAIGRHFVPLRTWKGLNTITLEDSFTQLGYGEAMLDSYGLLKKRRFIIYFEAGQSKQSFQEVAINSWDSALMMSGSPQNWEATGTVMKASPMGSETHIIVQEGLLLNVYKFKQEQVDHHVKIQFYQTLKFSTSVISWNTVNTDFENFLLVVTSKQIFIFSISDQQYKVTQTLNPSHGLNLFGGAFPVYVQSCTGEAMVVVGHGSRAAIYSFSRPADSNFFKVIYSTELPINITDWSNGFSFKDPSDEHIQLALVGADGLSRFVLVTSSYNILDPVSQQSQTLDLTMGIIQKEYNRQVNVMEKADELLMKSIDVSSNVNGNITITHSLTITQSLKTNSLVAENLTLLRTGIDVSHDSQYSDRITQIQDKVQERVTAITALETTLEDAVLSNDLSRVVSGYKTIVTTDLHLRELSTKTIVLQDTRAIAQLPLHSLLKQLIRVSDSGNKITGQKTFTSELNVGHLYTGSFDQVAVNDVVTVDSRHSIAGATFVNLLSVSDVVLQPNTTVGELDISKAVLLSDAFALGHIVLTRSLTVESSALVEIVNGVSIERFFTNTLQLTGGVIPGHLQFTQVLTIQNLEATAMMDVNSLQFLNDTLFKNADGILNGTLTVHDHIELERNLFTSSINNDDATPSKYLIRSGRDPIVFRGQTRFASVKFDRVKFAAGGLIDSIQLNNLLTKTTIQDDIAGKTFASGVYMENDLNLEFSSIGGVRLEDVLERMSQLPSGASSNHIIFKKAVQVPGVIYEGKLNGLNFSTFALDILYNDQNTIRINRKERFVSGVILADAQVNNHLNGEDSDTFVTSSGDQEIGGLKAFQSDVKYNALTSDLIDSVRIDALALSAIYLNRPNQIVTGKKTFTKLTAADYLEVTGEMSKIDFNKVVTYKGNQAFLAPQTFAEATFSTLEVNRINLYDHFAVNGVDLSKLYERRVPLKSAVNHNGRLVIHGPMSTIGMLSTDYLNDFDINDLQRNLVKDDRSSTVTGPVMMISLYVDGDLTTAHRMGGNGLNISKISSNSVKIQDTNIFTGFPFFSALELRGDVTVGELVSGIDLGELRDDAVYVRSSAHQAIKGKKTFLNGLHVKGDIDTERTNSIDLSTKLFTRNTDQHISSTFTFSDISTNNIFLLGVYNGIDIQQLNEMALKSGKAHIHGDAILSKNVIVRNLEIANTLNDIKLEEKLAAAVKSGDGEKITGKKIFISETRMKNIETILFRSFPFRDFVSNLIYKNAVVTLPGHVKVNGLVSSPFVSADHLIVEGLVDGENYRSLLKDAVYRSRHQIIETSIVLKENIIVKGNIDANLLNGFSILEDYLMTDVEQNIPATASFNDVSTNSIDVQGRVNAIQLPFENSASMQAVDGQLFDGPRIINGVVKVMRDLEVTGLIGSEVKYKLANEVIDLSENAPISGFVRFTAPVVASRLTSTKEQVNDVDVSDLYDKVWYVDQPTTITARMNFQEVAIMKAGLTSHGKVDYFNVSLIHPQTSIVLSTFANHTGHFKEEYKQMCNQVVSLYELLEDAVYEGECFEPLDYHSFPGSHQASTSFTAFNRTYLVMGFEGLCYSEVYLWNKISGTFEHYQTLVSTGYAQQWLVLQKKHFDKVILVAASSSTLGDCAQSNTTVWSVTRETIKLLQIIMPGKRLSTESTRTGDLLHVHTHPNTITYKYRQDSNKWIEISRISGTDFGISHVNSDGTTISFWSAGEESEVRIDATPVRKLRLGQNVLDAVVFEHHHRLHLILYVSIDTEDCPMYFLKFYEISHEGNLHCLDVLTLNAPGKLTSFFVGNDACGSLYVIVTQQKQCPLIYLLRGDELSLWKELSTPQIAWIQYFSVATQRFPSIVNHYLLLGQNDRQALVVFLVMRGSTVPENNGRCEVEAFISPRLTNILHPSRPMSVGFSPPPFLSSLSELLKSNPQISLLHFSPKETQASKNVSSEAFRPFLPKFQNTTGSPSHSEKGKGSSSANFGTLENPFFLTNLSSDISKSSQNQLTLNSSVKENFPSLFPTANFPFASSSNAADNVRLSPKKQEKLEASQENNGFIEIDPVITGQNLTENLTEQHPKSVLTVQHLKSVSTEQPPSDTIVDQPPVSTNAVLTVQHPKSVSTEQPPSDIIVDQPLVSTNVKQDPPPTSSLLDQHPLTEKQHSNASLGEDIPLELSDTVSEIKSITVVPEQQSPTFVPSIMTIPRTTPEGSPMITSTEQPSTTLSEHLISTFPPDEDDMSAEIDHALDSSKEKILSVSPLEQHHANTPSETDFTDGSTIASVKAHIPTSMEEHTSIDKHPSTNTVEEPSTTALAEGQSTLPSVEERPFDALTEERSVVVSAKKNLVVSPEQNSITASAKPSTVTLGDKSLQDVVESSTDITAAKEQESFTSTEPSVIMLTEDLTFTALTEDFSTLASAEGQASSTATEGHDSITSLVEDDSISVTTEVLQATIPSMEKHPSPIPAEKHIADVSEEEQFTTATEGMQLSVTAGLLLPAARLNKQNPTSSSTDFKSTVEVQHVNDDLIEMHAAGGQVEANLKTDSLSLLTTTSQVEQSNTTNLLEQFINSSFERPPVSGNVEQNLSNSSAEEHGTGRAVVQHSTDIIVAQHTNDSSVAQHVISNSARLHTTSNLAGSNTGDTSVEQHIATSPLPPKHHTATTFAEQDTPVVVFTKSQSASLAKHSSNAPPEQKLVSTSSKQLHPRVSENEHSTLIFIEQPFASATDKFHIVTENGEHHSIVESVLVHSVDEIQPTSVFMTQFPVSSFIEQPVSFHLRVHLPTDETPEGLQITSNSLSRDSDNKDISGNRKHESTVSSSRETTLSPKGDSYYYVSYQYGNVAYKKGEDLYGPPKYDQLLVDSYQKEKYVFDEERDYPPVYNEKGEDLYGPPKYDQLLVDSYQKEKYHVFDEERDYPPVYNEKGDYPPVHYQKGQHPRIHYQKGKYTAVQNLRLKYTASSKKDIDSSWGYQKGTHLLGPHGDIKGQYYASGDKPSYPNPSQNGGHSSPNGASYDTLYRGHYPSRDFQESLYSNYHKNYYPKHHSLTSAKLLVTKHPWARVYEPEAATTSANPVCESDPPSFFRPHPPRCNPFRPAKNN